jgi:hypothetical protein
MGHQEHIDQLLERYLGLLDTYSQLRGSLVSLHQRMHEDIVHTRASSDRGRHFGQECYSARSIMQATKRLEISEAASDDSGAPWTCRIVDAPPDVDDDVETTDSEKEDRADARYTRNPIRWFGLAVPASLHAAQARASQLITGLVPKLVTTEAEMRALEADIQQARERRAQAEMDGRQD